MRSTTPEAPASTLSVHRDQRVDPIGFVKELQDQHADGLKQAVKGRMEAGDLERVRGDFFEGLLVRPNAAPVDPSDLLRLYERKSITREELCSALSVKKEPLAEFLTQRQIDKLAGEGTPATPRLCVSRIKGVEVTLVEAMIGLSESLPKK